MPSFLNDLRRGFAVGLGLAVAVATSSLVGVAVSGTWNSFNAGDLVSATEINANFASLKSAVEKADEIPAGSIMPYAGSTVPADWLPCDGSAVSRADYAELFTAIGTTYGAGDGSTTFNLPDLRGEFLRGLDEGAGVDTGRGLGSNQSDAMHSHTHTDAGHSHPAWGHRISGVTGFGEVTLQAWDTIKTQYYNQGILTGFANLGTPADSGSGAPNLAAETRPRNVALKFIIKY